MTDIRRLSGVNSYYYRNFHDIPVFTSAHAFRFHLILHICDENFPIFVLSFFCAYEFITQFHILVYFMSFGTQHTLVEREIMLFSTQRVDTRIMFKIIFIIWHSFSHVFFFCSILFTFIL